MILIISEIVVGLKEGNLEALASNVSNGGHCKLAVEDSMLARSDRIFDILVMKKLLKVSAKTLAVVYSERADVLPRPRSLSTILNNLR